MIPLYTLFNENKRNPYVTEGDTVHWSIKLFVAKRDFDCSHIMRTFPDKRLQEF